MLVTDIKPLVGDLQPSLASALTCGGPVAVYRFGFQLSGGGVGP